MPEVRAKVTVLEAIREAKVSLGAAREAGTDSDTVRSWAARDGAFAHQLQEAERERSMWEQERWDRMMDAAIETLTDAMRAPESEVSIAMKLRVAKVLLRLKEKNGKAQELLLRWTPRPQDPEFPDVA
ncbi:MAG: hypothetical protein KIT83_07785 [Bryobacterales bacterium]|nr:hypothetical protein [Bryobacterales bacterium]